MKKNLLFIIFLLSTCFVFSQRTDDYYVSPDSSDYFKTVPFSHHKPFGSFSLAGRTQMSVQTGASSSFIGKENIFSSWIAPEINYALTPRFRLSLGTLVMHSNTNSFASPLNKETINSRMAGFTQNYIFAKGEYLLNDRIILTAATLHQLPAHSYNPYPSGFNSVGMDVKLTDNLSISGRYTFSRGMNSYGTSGNNLFFQSAFPMYNSGNTGW